MKKIIATGVAALALAACAVEPERSSTTMSPQEIEVLAIEITWIETGPEVCPFVRELRREGMPERAIHDFGVDAFRDGYPELSSAGERRLRELLGEC